jgi:hypothetical protein
MKWPGIFVLMTAEQRAVILIVMALLAAAMAKSYHDRTMHVPPVTSVPSQIEATPSIDSSEEEARDSGE